MEGPRAALDLLEPRLPAVKVPAGLLRVLEMHVVSRSLGMPYSRGRRFLEATAKLNVPPRDVELTDESVAGVPGKLFTPAGGDSAAGLVYLHGGAYCYGSPSTHAAMLAMLAKDAGVTVYAPDYSLAPEHPYPAAIDDVLAVWAELAGNGPVVLGGDSAGGGLALASTIRLRDDGAVAPSGLLLISPWVDLAATGDSYVFNADRDALFRPQNVERNARAYAGGLELTDPRVSPLNGELAGLPPAIIQSAALEILLSEGEELARRLSEAGGDVDFRVFDDVWHDFQLHAALTPESAEAVSLLGRWLRERLAMPPR